MTDTVTAMNYEAYAIYFLYTLIYLGFAVVLKQILNFRASTVYSADEQIINGNLAVGLRRSGAQFGLALAMMGVLSGGAAPSLLNDILLTLFYGVLGTLFIVSSLFITDRLVLPGVDNLRKIANGTVAVGMVEFGMLVSTGIIAFASIVGEGGGWLSSIIYFVVGQITLVLLVLIYERVLIRNFNIVEAIGGNNVAAGIYLGGKLIAYALILKTAIAGNGTDAALLDHVEDFVLLAVSGMLMLYVFERLIDALIVTTSNVAQILEEDRVVPVVQLTASKIGMAILLSNAIL